MNKKVLIAILAVLILGGSGVVGYFWLVKDKAGSTKKQNIINLADPSQVFNITVPADFDTNKKQRLEEKIINAKDLYQNKPDDTWTWITIGNMYEFARDYDRAIGVYEKAASLNGSEYISRMNLAYIYEKQKNDYPKAEEYYKKVVELNAADPENYLNLAKLYEYKMSRPYDAENMYLKGLKNTGNNAELLVATIYFYQRTKQPDQATEYAGQLLKLYPDNGLYQNDFGPLLK